MGELTFKFDSRKTAQAVAFLLRLCGGSKSKGHVIKMLYGADKNQIRKTGMPLTGDSLCSLRNGPILSNVLDLLDGDAHDDFWSEHISTASRDTYLVRLIKDLPEDLLSQSEKESLKKAWAVFNGMSWTEVKKFCHDKKIFPEWDDPGFSQKAIAFETLYSAVGRDSDFAEEMKSRDAEEKIFAQLIENAETAG